jgi:hypothetical protein
VATDQQTGGPSELNELGAASRRPFCSFHERCIHLDTIGACRIGGRRPDIRLHDLAEPTCPGEGRASPLSFKHFCAKEIHQTEFDQRAGQQTPRERGALAGPLLDPAPHSMNIFAAGRRRALRTVQEYWQTAGYIHLNPLRRGLVERAEGWRWSSAAEYRESRRTSKAGAVVL